MGLVVSYVEGDYKMAKLQGYKMGKLRVQNCPPQNEERVQKTC